MNIRRRRHFVCIIAWIVFSCGFHAGTVRPAVADSDRYLTQALQVQVSPRPAAAVHDDSVKHGPDSLIAITDSVTQRDSSLSAISDSLAATDSLTVADSLAQNAVPAEPEAAPVVTPEQKTLDEERERYRQEYETEQNTGLAVPKPVRTQTEPPRAEAEGSIERAAPERQVPAERARENTAVPAGMERARQQAVQEREDDDARKAREKEAEERERELREQSGRE